MIVQHTRIFPGRTCHDARIARRFEPGIQGLLAGGAINLLWRDPPDQQTHSGTLPCRFSTVQPLGPICEKYPVGTELLAAPPGQSLSLFRSGSSPQESSLRSAAPAPVDNERRARVFPVATVSAAGFLESVPSHVSVLRKSRSQPWLLPCWRSATGESFNPLD
ncbi:hypothetical protein VTN02DRAFT_4198 [Thermoascus thermophilus]